MDRHTCYIFLSILIFNIAQLYSTDNASGLLQTVKNVVDYVPEHPYKALGAAAALYGTKKALESRIARQIGTTVTESALPFNLGKYTTISEIRAGHQYMTTSYEISISYTKNKPGFMNVIQSLLKYNTTKTYNSKTGYNQLSNALNNNCIYTILGLTPSEILLYFAICDAPDSDYRIDITVMHNDIKKSLSPITITTQYSPTNNKIDFVKQAYEQIIEPRICDKNIYTVRDIPDIKNIANHQYSCIITPYSLAEYYLGKGIKSRMLQNLPSSIPYLLQPGIALADYDINQLKETFCQWAHYMYTDKNNEEVQWNLFPSYTMYFNQPIDPSHSSATYTLQPEKVSFGKKNLSYCYRQIRQHFNNDRAIELLTNHNNGLQSYYSLKKVQAILKETMNMFLQIPDMFTLISNMFDYTLSPQIKNDIAAIPITYNPAAVFLITQDQDIYNNYTSYNQFFNTSIVLCRNIQQHLQAQYQSTRTKLGTMLVQMFENTLSAIAQYEPFILMEETLHNFNQNNAQFLAKNNSLSAASTALLNKIRQIRARVNPATFTLAELQRLANNIIQSDTTSFITTEEDIFNLCGFAHIPHIHNYITLPQSLFEFIDRCKRSTDARDKTLQEKYFKVIFDLYIAPLFT